MVCMNAQKIILALGGTNKVAALCRCKPQAVSQWFGIDPATGKERTIPVSRELYLRAIRPDVFPPEQGAESGTDARVTVEPKRAEA